MVIYMHVHTHTVHEYVRMPSTVMSQYQLVQPGETLPINLLAIDQVGNSREAVWSLEAPQQEAVS